MLLDQVKSCDNISCVAMRNLIPSGKYEGGVVENVGSGVGGVTGGNAKVVDVEV